MFAVFASFGVDPTPSERFRAAGANLRLRARLSDRLGRHCQIVVAMLSEALREAATVWVPDIGSLMRPVHAHGLVEVSLWGRRAGVKIGRLPADAGAFLTVEDVD